MKDKMRNYIILDIEATCWHNNDKQNLNNMHETIEIGAVKLNENLEFIDVFSEFIKPVYHSILSDFCKNLTSITQEQVSNAKIFYDVMMLFDDWVFKETKDIKLGSWGWYDQKQLLKESDRHHCYNTKFREACYHHN